jgi:hypothetical protein
MVQARTVLFWAAAAVAEFGFSNAASAQYVNSTAFCRSVQEHKCVGALAEDQSISIRDLRKVDGSPAVYFFADVNASKLTPFVINMVRQGACYTTNDSIRLIENPGMVETGKAWFQSGRWLDAIAETFDIKKTSIEVGADVHVGVAAIDAKVTPVIVPFANNFSIDDYRYATCAGTFSADIMDVDHHVIPGTNPVRKITITE